MDYLTVREAGEKWSMGNPQNPPMKESEPMRRSGVIVSTLLFFLIILSVFYFFVMLTKAPRQKMPDLQKGHADLSGFDLDTILAILPEEYFLYYEGMLYTPEDMVQGRIPQWPPEGGKSSELRKWENCGTYRITLALPAGKTYGISAYSAMYSQKLFVNEKELSVVGMPGTTAETTVPNTNHYTVYFTPDTDRTEILIQAASFHHADGGGLLDLMLGTAENITDRDMSALVRIYLLAGSVVTSFVLSLGLFLFFRKHYIFLWFSLACLSIGIRMVVVEEKAILRLLPNLRWEITIGLEYLSIILALFFFIMYIRSIFPGALHKYPMIAFSVFCSIYSFVVLLTPPVVYTRLFYSAVWGSRLFLIYVEGAVILRLVRKKDRFGLDYLLLFAETIVFISFVLLDTYWYKRGGYHMALGLTNLGMVVLIFANMIVLVMNFSRIEAERDKAWLAEREARETNRLMESLNRVRAEFMQNLSHEMRTPLTIMSNCAGLTSRQIRKDMVDDETLENLEIIKKEAARLAELVERLKEISLEKERQLALTDTDMKTLLERAVDVGIVMCRKNGNSILVEAVPEHISMRVNADGIFQVLVNLIVNANRHTKQDIILLKAELITDNTQLTGVRISITDHGDGIPQDLLPHVFKRNMSGDGGTGLGLAICKEIIEEHGGIMKIESKQGKGTTVQFALPCKNSCEKGETA